MIQEIHNQIWQWVEKEYMKAIPFLRHFAEAWSTADSENRGSLGLASYDLIKKYNLWEKWMESQGKPFKKFGEGEQP